MADPFKPDPTHDGLWYPNDSVIEDPAGSGRYAPIDLTEDPAGSGLYQFDALAPVSGPYWDWGDDGTSGRVSFTNYGNAPTWPIVTATGGMSGGFVVTDVTLGQSVRFERVIPIGSLISLNFRTGRAWINAPGNDVSGSITVPDFFQIGPGETHIIQFAALGTVTGVPQFTATISPAFL